MSQFQNQSDMEDSNNAFQNPSSNQNPQTRPSDLTASLSPSSAQVPVDYSGDTPQVPDKSQDPSITVTSTAADARCEEINTNSAPLTEEPSSFTSGPQTHEQTHEGQSQSEGAALNFPTDPRYSAYQLPVQWRPMSLDDDMLKMEEAAVPPLLAQSASQYDYARTRLGDLQAKEDKTSFDRDLISQFTLTISSHEYNLQTSVQRIIQTNKLQSCTIDLVKRFNVIAPAAQLFFDIRARYLAKSYSHRHQQQDAEYVKESNEQGNFVAHRAQVSFDYLTIRLKEDNSQDTKVEADSFRHLYGLTVHLWGELEENLRCSLEPIVNVRGEYKATPAQRTLLWKDLEKNPSVISNCDNNVATLDILISRVANAKIWDPSLQDQTAFESLVQSMKDWPDRSLRLERTNRRPRGSAR